MVVLKSVNMPLRSSLLDDEPELVVLIEKYINQYPAMMVELNRVFEKKDWVNFEKQLHNIKSTGGNYGFMCITEQAVKIKNHLHAGDSNAIKGLLRDLEGLHQRMLLGLKTQRE